MSDRIYLLGNEGLDNESVIALSVKDGSRVWAAKLGKVGHPEQNPNYPGARSTPTGAVAVRWRMLRLAEKAYRWYG